jgi:23S rRNA (guanine745-N1)-methyltransferase
MVRGSGSLRCASGHVFDIARQGYVSLLPPGAKGNGGDTAAMVQARDDFLNAGHFATLAAAVAQTSDDVTRAGGAPGCVVDVGAGTGYYLVAVLDRLPGRVGLALDISKFALRRAARAHPRIGAVACDVWRSLPVADAAAALALNVFAPRNGAELHRILNPAGRLLIITPTSDHLNELIGPLGLLTVDPHKEERLAEKLVPYFEVNNRHEHRSTLSLDHKTVGAVVAMGPSSWHTDSATLAARIGLLPDPMPVTLAVTLSLFRPSAADPPRPVGP